MKSDLSGAAAVRSFSASYSKTPWLTGTAWHAMERQKRVIGWRIATAREVRARRPSERHN